MRVPGRVLELVLVPGPELAPGRELELAQVRELELAPERALVPRRQLPDC